MLICGPFPGQPAPVPCDGRRGCSGATGGGLRRRSSCSTRSDPRRRRSAANQVALADDRTAPLAALVGGRLAAIIEWTGLFDAGFKQLGVKSGLYMIRPYEPGKIPIVFVHGLFSSPRAWVQTINELRNSPAIAARYSSGSSSIRPACRSPPPLCGCASRWHGPARRSTRGTATGRSTGWWSSGTAWGASFQGEDGPAWSSIAARACRVRSRSRSSRVRISPRQAPEVTRELRRILLEHLAERGQGRRS